MHFAKHSWLGCILEVNYPSEQNFGKFAEPFKLIWQTWHPSGYVVRPCGFLFGNWQFLGKMKTLSLLPLSGGIALSRVSRQ
jgi:hypothetical protein